MNDLTRRQRDILDFLSDFIRANGYPPTIREIRDAFQFKSNRSVVDHLRALERKSFIRRNQRSSRAIEILNHVGEDNTLFLRRNRITKYPVVGRITAGELAPPIEDVDEELILDKRLFHEPGDFILEVKGESMINDHIVPGDLLVVRKVQRCKNNDVVVALVDGEATVKRYVLRGDQVILQPANRRYTPVVFSGKDSRTCSIIGKVVGVIRRLPRRKSPFSD